MKKILVIQGGGRPKGNTAQLVDISGRKFKILMLRRK